MRPKVTVNTTIRVNGQAYASADAMPSDIRQVDDRALAAIDGGTYRGPLSILTAGFEGDGNSNDPVESRVSNRPIEAEAVSNTRIVVHGHESGSVNQMPGEIRVVATLAGDRKTSAQTNQAPPLDDEAIRSILAVDTARPESTTWRVIIAGMVVAAMLLAAFVFGW